MNKLRAAVAGAVALAIAGYFLIVRVPADSIVLVETASGSTPVPLPAGLHLRPFGSTLVWYPALPITASGQVILDAAQNRPVATLPFTVTGRLDPARAADLHDHIGGRPLEDFLLASAADRLEQELSGSSPADLFAQAAREQMEQRAAAALAQAGFLEARIEIARPGGDLFLSAAQRLAGSTEAWRLRIPLSEALLDPNVAASWKTHTAMGIVNEAEKMFADAERNYLDALAIDPVAIPPMTQLVRLYSAVAEWHKLTRVVDAALTAKPDSLPHINWAAVALLKLGQMEAAERVLKSGLALEPNNATLLANLGGVYLKAGRTQEAVDQLRKAVESAPNSQQALFNLGAALASLGSAREALPYLQRAEQAGAMTLPLAHTLATVHERLGDEASAAAYHQRAAQLEASQPQPTRGDRNGAGTASQGPT